MKKLLKFIFINTSMILSMAGSGAHAAVSIGPNASAVGVADGIKKIFYNWVNDTNGRHDLSKYYAEKLTYYRYKEYSKYLVIKDKNAFYKKYNAISIGISEERVKNNINGTYTISYLKIYSATTSNRMSFIAGYARSILIFANQDNNWLIVDEHDEKTIKPQVWQLRFGVDTSESDRHETATKIAHNITTLAIYAWMADEEKIPPERRMPALDLWSDTINKFRSIGYPYYDNAWIEYVHGLAITSCRELIIVNGIAQQPPVNIIINKIDHLFVGFLADSLMKAGPR